MFSTKFISLLILFLVLGTSFKVLPHLNSDVFELTENKHNSRLLDSTGLGQNTDSNTDSQDQTESKDIYDGSLLDIDASLPKIDPSVKGQTDVSDITDQIQNLLDEIPQKDNGDGQFDLPDASLPEIDPNDVPKIIYEGDGLGPQNSDSTQDSKNTFPDDSDNTTNEIEATSATEKGPHNDHDENEDKTKESNETSHTESNNETEDIEGTKPVLPENQFNFSLVLNLDIPTFNSKITEFKAALVNLINDPTASAAEKESFVQIVNVTNGSIVVEGILAAKTAAAIDQTKQNFDNVVSIGSSFAGIPVLKSGTTTVKYQSSTTTTSSSSTPATSSNTGMIIGIAVGVACAVIVGVAIASYFLCCKKKSASIEDNLNEKRTTSTIDDFAAAETIQSDHGINNVQYPELNKGQNNNRIQL